MKQLQISLLLAAALSLAAASANAQTATSSPAAGASASPSTPPTIASTIDREISLVEKEVVEAAEALANRGAELTAGGPAASSGVFSCRTIVPVVISHRR